MPITLDETAAAAASFTIVFTACPKGPMPQVLLRRYSCGSSPFVGLDGRWQASWLPPRLAASPFDILEYPEGGHALALHNDGGFVSGDEDPFRIFNANEGARPTLSPAVTEIAAVLKTHAEALASTAHATTTLVELGLLTALDPEADERLRVVDHDVARALNETEIITLYRARAIGLLHASLVSLSHLPWMAKAERLLAKSSAPRPKRKFKAPSNTPGANFLSALAEAQAVESGPLHINGLKS